MGWNLFGLLPHKGFFSPLDKGKLRKGQLQYIPHPTMQKHDLLCSLFDCCASMKRMCVDGRDGKLPPSHEGIENSWCDTNSLFEEDQILSVVQNARTLLCNSWSLEIVLAWDLFLQKPCQQDEQWLYCCGRWGKDFTPLRKVCFRKCFLDDFLESSLLTDHCNATLNILSIVSTAAKLNEERKGGIQIRTRWMIAVQPRESQERKSRGSNPFSFAISSRNLLQLWMSFQ